MSNVNGGANGRLAEKLRHEYRNRGASLNGMGATPTSELMKRAQMGRDPRENVSAKAFDDRMNGTQNRTGRVNGAKASANGRNSARTTGNASAQNGAAFGGARRANGAFGGGQRSERVHREDPVRPRYNAPMNEEEPLEEIRVERKKIPAGFLMVLAFCTVMIMLILTSVAQIYQKTSENSDKEATVSALKANIEELELKIDEKNDIRLIEQMATVELGMVKADAVQRKYISLSDGEHIDLVVDDAEEETGGGTVLSGFFEMFGGFLEYFD